MVQYWWHGIIYYYAVTYSFIYNKNQPDIYHRQALTPSNMKLFIHQMSKSVKRSKINVLLSKRGHSYRYNDIDSFCFS